MSVESEDTAEEVEEEISSDVDELNIPSASELDKAIADYDKGTKEYVSEIKDPDTGEPMHVLFEYKGIPKSEDELRDEHTTVRHGRGGEPTQEVDYVSLRTDIFCRGVVSVKPEGWLPIGSPTKIKRLDGKRWEMVKELSDMIIDYSKQEQRVTRKFL